MSESHEAAQREALIDAKIKELKTRIADPESEDPRRTRQEFINALGWYTSARGLAQEQDLNHDDRMVLQEQMQAIADHGQSFEGLNSEFSSYSDDELQRIRQSLFVF